MPRFAVLCHDSPRGRHWDLFVENGDSLKTWALDQPPAPATVIGADLLPDHRTIYLDYEGPLSGDRGSVTRWDTGSCIIVAASDAEWTIDLQGEHTTGRAVIRRTAARWELRLNRNSELL